jgi:predicted nuclease of predicted toxin-antitoxin system
MTFLLDQGLPRSTVERLRSLGIESVHVGEIGLSRARDSEIVEHARQRGEVVVTLDADFHAIVALSGASGPSVIRIRIESLKAGPLAALLATVVANSAGRIAAREGVACCR